MLKFDELSNAQIKVERDQLSKVNERAEEEMAIAKSESITRLKESAWLKYYLPLFFDSSLLPEGMTLPEVWVKLSGSLTNSVMIVDDNDNDVIEVPPMMKTYKDFGELDDINLPEIGGNFLELQNKNKTYLSGDVPAGIMEAVLDQCVPDDAPELGWEKLWKYYLNYEEIEEQTEIKSTESDENNDVLIDF